MKWRRTKPPQTPRGLRIGIDLDGCLYPFVDCLRAWVESTEPQGRTFPAAHRWEFYKDWGFTTPEFLAHAHAAADAGHLFVSQPACRQDVAMMRVAMNAGHEIHLVTARGFGRRRGATSRRNTRRWLKAHQVPYTSLTFSEDKTVVPVDVFCEDNADNIRDLQATGTRTWVIDRLYNQDVAAPRASSVAGFLAAVMVGRNIELGQGSV